MTIAAIFAQGGGDTLGAAALYLLLLWLASAVAASWLSGRAGYGERTGLATGLLLSALGALAWLVIYLAFPRPDSRRALDGIIPTRRKAGDMDIASRPGG
jgi:hypothetical protein